MGRTPVNKKRIDNKSKQMEIASRLGVAFFENGFSNYSTEEICEIAQKSKATIYKYFRSKEEIVEFITQMKLTEIHRFADLLSDNTMDYPERYRSAVELVINAFSGISHLFLDDLKKEYPNIFEVIVGFKNISINLLEDFYNQGVTSGGFRDLNPKLLAANDDLFFTSILETDFLTGKEFTIQELFENYFSARFNGILK
jgi:AcrR family transcriptional regulator